MKFLACLHDDTTDHNHTHTHAHICIVYGICCIYALGQAVWLRDGVIKIRDTDCQILANKLTSDRAKATAQKARFMGSAAGWAGQVVKERGRREGGEHKQHSTR